MKSEELPCDDCGQEGEDCECCPCDECWEVGIDIEERANDKLLCDICWDAVKTEKL